VEVVELVAKLSAIMVAAEVAIVAAEVLVPQSLKDTVSITAVLESPPLKSKPVPPMPLM
jgi:hypothetical protein